MKTTSYGKSQRLKNLVRLCLFLVLVCLITTGTIGCDEGMLAIKLFKADPMVLNDGDFAVYAFMVKGATEIKLIEAGNIIYETKGPSSGTYKGTVPGNTTFAIRTGEGNTFETVLIARNESGKEVEKRLTLSFATELPLPPAPPPIGDTGLAEGEARSPQWGEQYSSPLTTQPPSTTTNNEPEFFKCPSNCNYCLKPDEAAGRQRCSEEPCYYSPNLDQKWFCYGELVTCWCCVGGQVGEIPQTQCLKMGGACYSTQFEAMQACQPPCWCCVDGQVGQTTRTHCLQMGGACYATQSQAMQACQPVTCWCCAGGKVFQTTQKQCAKTGGTCYATQSQAAKHCEYQLK